VTGDRAKSVVPSFATEAKLGQPFSGAVRINDEAGPAPEDFAEPGVGAGFPARCGRGWTNDPGAERGGCLYARVFGVGSGYELCQPKGDASVGSDRRRTRATAGDPLRQRTGTDQPAFSGVVRRTEDRTGAHSAGKADAERPSGEFPRTVAG